MGIVSSFASAPDRFDEWLRVPLPSPECSDPRFEVRRADPADFERIYDLVDASFETKRPRAAYDWIYRCNPLGKAHCWIMLERDSGRLAGAQSSFPWPLAFGEEPVPDGYQAGDWAIAPSWQRQGLNEVLSQVRRTHPWRSRAVSLSWPNEKSRGSSTKRGRGGRSKQLPRAVMPLRSRAHLERRGWPPAIAATAGAVADSALQAWKQMRRAGGGAATVEPVHRFDSAFDEVTERTMSWDFYWSPHAGEFLNWRYLQHPTNEYFAFALAAEDGLAGYGVVRIAAEQAWLMEFAAPQSPESLPQLLLLHVAQAAREAGCASLEFVAPPGWRHWPLFRSLGLVQRPSTYYLYTRGPRDDAGNMDLWQCVPGDIDIL